MLIVVDMERVTTGMGGGGVRGGYGGGSKLKRWLW